LNYRPICDRKIMFRKKQTMKNIFVLFRIARLRNSDLSVLLLK
jgi:hypothetical protein